MPPHTSFEIIENRGPNNLRNVLITKCSFASQVEMAVAFTSESGVRDVLPALQRVAASGSVRILTGLYQAVTEPKALRTLLTAQCQFRDRFSVRISTEKHFHSKLYLLHGSKQTIAIIGSSNLTLNGLHSAGELNIMFLAPVASQSMRQLNQNFDTDWHHRSVPLTSERIDQYEELYAKRQRPDPVSGRALSQILRLRKSDEKDQAAPVARYWRYWLTGVLDKQTMQIITQTTNWDRKNYLYFQTEARHPFQISDKIFLFDVDRNSFSLVQVADVRISLKMNSHFGRR